MGFNGHMLLGCLGCNGHMFFFMGFYDFFNGIQWRSNGISWDLNIIPSGKLLQFAIENDHRNGGFTQLENGGSFHSYVAVYQRVTSVG